MSRHSAQKASNESRKPSPAYFSTSETSSPLRPDPAFYGPIGSSGSSSDFTQSDTKPQRTLVSSLEVPIRTAKAWKVPAGHVCRLKTPKGPQVGDLNIWNFNDPRERFWASRTRQLHQAHVSVGDRLWSCLPFLRPLCTIVGDTLQDYGTDKWGGRVHDLLGTRCDPYVDALLTNGENQVDFHCHSNLTRAVMEFGLTEFDVHDVLNVFQVTGLDENERYFMETCPADKEDYFEFFAEVDLLCALSACPGGDLSKWGWEDEKEQLECCRPLGVEVYRLDDELLKGWKSPERAPYHGKHGLKYDN